jgi:hypothetical protein
MDKTTGGGYSYMMIIYQPVVTYSLHQFDTLCPYRRNIYGSETIINCIQTTLSHPKKIRTFHCKFVKNITIASCTESYRAVVTITHTKSSGPGYGQTKDFLISFRTPHEQ